MCDTAPFNVFKAVRLLFGLTQVELAKKTGIQQNFYTRIETGTKKSQPALTRISKCLNLNQSLFLGESGYPFLSDFYIFQLDKKNCGGLDFILKMICQPSTLIDILFLRTSIPSQNKGKVDKYRRGWIALRDNQDTVFLIKYGTFPITPHSFIVYSDLLHKNIYSLKKGPMVFEKQSIISEELAAQIDRNNIGKKDILPLFPTTEYFLQQISSRTHLQ